MVRMDWDRILMIKAESLTDDDIEDLFPMVIRCDIDDVENIKNLRALMKLSQEMLQHKDNQVESLLLECDELKEKVSSALSESTKSQRKTSPVIGPDDIERDDSDDKRTDLSVSDNYRDVKKSDKIKTLTNELEALENENDTLKRKLDVLKDEMEDATESMNEMTEELEELRKNNSLQKDEIERIQSENTELLAQIDELTAQQAERDKAIDEFSVALEERTAEWQKILEEKNTEISNLQEELSHTVTQETTPVREQSKSQILYLNEEIDRREAIIADLQSKLLEASEDINESAALIERLKNDAKKTDKNGRRNGQKELLKKIQTANERISILEDALRQAEEDLTLKSEQLCETLVTLRKYEDKERGLADTIKEVKELKEQLLSKNSHVQELISVINNLEALNSSREMQILALREKLGMPEDEEIPIEGVVLKSQEEARIRNELLQKNEDLERENVAMKSDLKTLRYKLNRLGERVIMGRDKIDARDTKVHTTKVVDERYREGMDEETVSLQHRAEIDEIKYNVRIVIEENEALRKGMHEILDSIHDQDGKSRVEIQSDTLERLLEALDVRHIAGWYHPAMRLQERLNVVQGSNSELRSQLRQMRKELHKKDGLLRSLSLKRDAISEKQSSEDSENEEIRKSYTSEVQRIQTAYRDELEKWQREKDAFDQENKELRDTVEKLTAQLEVLDRDLKTIESGEDELKQAFATKSRECAESALNVIVANRKCTTLENLLNAEAAKGYRQQKEAIDCENAFRKALVDADRRNKILENEIMTVRSNLSNSISLVEYNELREKYEESSMRFRAGYELQLAATNAEDSSTSAQAPESGEQPSATNLETLHDISQRKLAKCETELHRITEMNSELRQQLVDLQKELSKQTRPQKLMAEEKCKSCEELEGRIGLLAIENENLTRTLEITREEAQMHYTTNSLKTFELDSLRHQILDLLAVSEDKDTIARLGFELTNCKASEIELNKRKVQLENDVLHLREDLESSNRKLDETRSQLQDCRKLCSSRCSRSINHHGENRESDLLPSEHQ